MNPLVELAAQGQSIWLDYIRRGMTRNGELAQMVARDGLRGMTSNPAIFQQAIAGSDDYATSLRALAGDRDLDTKTVFETLAIEDIREAADVLREVYDRTNALDGYVSIEVSPSLALDPEGTLAEARRLWRSVDRPNVMIKVPGTDACVDAIETLLAEGINVNITLLFSVSAYEKVAHAYVRALERRVTAGQSIDRVASVASFFVSRIDSEVDARLAKLKQAGGDAGRIDSLLGKAAIANAKIAYADVYLPLIRDARWQALTARGARPQRLLWASTGTKNKAYSDVLYIDELIGPDTVNTAPPATIDAFRDHGKLAPRLLADVDGARAVMQELKALGIDFAAVTDQLLERGMDLFSEAIDQLLMTVAAKQRQAQGPRLNRLDLALPGALGEVVAAASAAWDQAGNTARLWNRDASLWTGSDEASWLGWLDIVEQQRANVDALRIFADDVAASGFKDVLLLGMGGSSLCPDVLARTYGPGIKDKQRPKLRILDSTVPDQVRRLTSSVDPETTLYIVASKSGSTLEPKVFADFTLAQAKHRGDDAARRFVAITDPGSKLEAQARKEGFRAIFHGVPTIGGRYSALSNFGLVPAAVMGLDVGRLLAEAGMMVDACRNSARAVDNPGIALGIVMGTAANHGRDKLTIFGSPAIASLGAWLEQLIAESTGKNGKAIIPVDGESIAAPSHYGHDRLFVYLRLGSAPDASQDRKVGALIAAGQPVVRIDIADLEALPQEFFRWEIATAVAGAMMKLNPFDQPDVEASKIATRAMTSAFEESGSLPAETPWLQDGEIALYTDAANVAALDGAADFAAAIASHLRRIGSGDYVALLAYLDMTSKNERTLQAIRELIRERTRAATCVGFGPRFLHSTGQAYKGGPASGVVLQITCDGDDLGIPGARAGFATIAAAQARGDFEVLVQRKRRALRVHLGRDVARGLTQLEAAVRAAFGG